jgi:hypothetical protein
MADLAAAARHVQLEEQQWLNFDATKAKVN